MNGQNVHVLAFILISNKGLDQNYPYYWKAYNNDRIRVRSRKHISSGRTALEYKSQRLKEWLDQMSLLTTHHLMQTLLYTWGQPWVSHCPGQTRRDGPCLPSPLVFLIMCFFFFLSFLYFQIFYLACRIEIKSFKKYVLKAWYFTWPFCWIIFLFIFLRVLSFSVNNVFHHTSHISYFPSDLFSWRIKCFYLSEFCQKSPSSDSLCLLLST